MTVRMGRTWVVGLLPCSTGAWWEGREQLWEPWHIEVKDKGFQGQGPSVLSLSW